MELRTLRALVEVVRQGGFSPAARTLFTTQSNVSKAVKSLEEELGCQLLDRIGHRSVLTEAGVIVHERAQAMLAAADSLVDELDALRGMRRGTLRIGLPPVGSDILFAPLLARYRAKYPQIDISLVERGGRTLRDMVLSGELDLAAAMLPVDEEQFEWKPVRTEPVDALVNLAHPLAKQKQVSLRELADTPFVLFESSFALNQVILDACHRQGFAPRVAVSSSQIDFIVELIAVGMGVAFMPRLIARQRSHPRVRRIALDDAALEWTIAMIWRRGGRLPQTAQAWLDLVR